MIFVWPEKRSLFFSFGLLTMVIGSGIKSKRGLKETFMVTTFVVIFFALSLSVSLSMLQARVKEKDNTDREKGYA